MPSCFHLAKRIRRNPYAPQRVFCQITDRRRSRSGNIHRVLSRQRTICIIYKNRRPVIYRVIGCDSFVVPVVTVNLRQTAAGRGDLQILCIIRELLASSIAYQIAALVILIIRNAVIVLPKSTETWRKLRREVYISSSLLRSQVESSSSRQADHPGGRSEIESRLSSIITMSLICTSL